MKMQQVSCEEGCVVWVSYRKGMFCLHCQNESCALYVQQNFILVLAPKSKNLG